jgi:hypothetical protein
MRAMRLESGRIAPRPIGSIRPDGYAQGEGGDREHVLVAERALGHALPERAVVHHVNEDGTDNRNCNLVICNDQSYHMHLHKRMRAKAVCGNPNWLKCVYCHVYEDPERLVIRRYKQLVQYHRTCRNEYEAARKFRRRRRAFGEIQRRAA